MRGCHEVDSDVFGAQLSTLLTDIEVKAVKLGILGSQSVISELAEHLDLPRAPVVWDPVMAPTQGDVRFGPELFRSALEELGRHLTLVTPNTEELGRLTGTDIRDLAQAVTQARALAEVSKVAVLVKGGHLSGEESVDVLCHDGGTEYLKARRIATEDVHGTGCALSTAIAVHLAHGLPLAGACREAKRFVAERISHAVRPGRGAPAVV